MKSFSDSNDSMLRLEPVDLPELLDDDTEADRALSQAKALWFFGDWSALCAISREEIAGHPERARLALLVASANSQTGNAQQARELVRASLEWGCPHRLVAQVLTAGIHNSLGRAAALIKDDTRLRQHFNMAVATVAGSEQAQLVSQARAVREMTRLGLLPQATQILDDALGEAAEASGLRPLQKQATLDALKREMDLLRSEVSAVQQTRLGDSFTPRPESLVDVPSLQRLAQSCLDDEDPLAAIDECLEGKELTSSEKFQFAVALSDLFFEQGDGLNGQNYLAIASQFIAEDDRKAVPQRQLLARRLAQKGRVEQALDLAVVNIASELRLPENRSRQLLEMYERLRAPKIRNEEHGHDLLLAALTRIQQSGASLEGKLLIEIGSTREDVPGQGSTAKLADFCAAHDMRFITVDMDPHNTRSAQRTIAQFGNEFEAVTGKGEHFLREFDGSPDFVFLDAYDFNHGNHSALRQNRYVQFLGSEINDADCHQMHLDCAGTLAEKLAAGGLICIDDTWQENGEWTAKGKLAVPFLLSEGFQILESRNRAVVMQRVDESSE